MKQFSATEQHLFEAVDLVRWLVDEMPDDRADNETVLKSIQIVINKYLEYRIDTITETTERLRRVLYTALCLADSCADEPGMILAWIGDMIEDSLYDQHFTDCDSFSLSYGSISSHTMTCPIEVYDFEAPHQAIDRLVATMKRNGITTAWFRYSGVVVPVNLSTDTPIDVLDRYEVMVRNQHLNAARN